MLTRNFYVVLGVPQTESSAGIRQAFRELALRYHPDRAGSQSTPYFQDLVEAYQTLSDPDRRASYDEGLRHAGDLPVRRGAPVTPGFRGAAEPLAPVRASLFRDFEVTRPSAAEVFERIFRSFSEPWFPKSQRLDPLDLELQLSADEAARGGVLDLGVPVFYPCRACHGTGHAGGFACHGCDGRGLAEEEERVRIAIPRMVADGTVMQVPLRGLGIRNTYLQILIRVSA
jgi:DnaJ-class molecular chaperone